jgi:hypothetical protein
MNRPTAPLGVVGYVPRALRSACAPAAILVAALAAGGCDSLPWSSKDDPASGSSTSAVTSCAGPSDQVPDDLACTGLYTDYAAKVVAPTARPYQPGATLWSDGYEKSRFISLPEGTKIDAKKMDSWQFPVGTKTWKEFRHGDHRIETRFFWKVKTDKWLSATYKWSDDGTHAARSDGENISVDGKPYHIPKLTECEQCHRGREDRILGFEAILLSLPTATGLTLGNLVGENRIDPKPDRTILTLPDPGMGVLHANCGITCHNDTPNAFAFSSELRFRIGWDEITTKPLADWEVLQTALGVPSRFTDGEVRITPGVPDTSLLIKLMKTRGQGQMPPLGTNEVDTQGVAAVEAWIRTLPAPVVTGNVSVTP